MSDTNLNDIIESLASGTNFKLSSKSEVLTTRKKVPTPLEVINCLLGGGIPFGTIYQSYGEPKTGKSTWSYQTMGIFQKLYPNGVAVVIDNEASADSERLEYLGVDTSKVLRLPSTSIESGFLSLLKLLDNKKKIEQLKDVPVFVIWDTISKGLAQDNSTQSRMNAQDRARIIKNYMSPVLTEIEKQDFILCLLNQVIFKTDKYGNTKTDSGGGIALKHDVHLSTKLSLGGDTYNGNYIVSRSSKLNIDKSKLGPEFYGIDVVIDITAGGMIDTVKSFVDYLINSDMITQAKGWYKLDNLIETYKLHPISKILNDYNRSYRYDPLVEAVANNKIFYEALKLALTMKIEGIYKLQSLVMKPYKEERINNILDEFSAFSLSGVIPDDVVLDNKSMNEFISNESNKDKLYDMRSHKVFDSYYQDGADPEVLMNYEEVKVAVSNTTTEEVVNTDDNEETNGEEDI